MKVLLTSPDAVCSNGSPDSSICDALRAIPSDDVGVALVSNHEKPHWFDEEFGDTDNLAFFPRRRRQTGDIVADLADHLDIETHDILVLATKLADMQMAKNGNGALIAAGWSDSNKVKGLGIQAETPQELEEIVALSEGWEGGWYYQAQGKNYALRALADFSTYGKSFDQQRFRKCLTSTVKSGGPELVALLVVTARSLLEAGFGSVDDLAWGVYPSSDSNNDDEDVLSDFAHRLRTTVSKVHFAKRGEPLFIRHSTAPKRSKGQGGCRIDPSKQMQTIHINPEYKGRLNGRNVVVVDDCTTYGVSMGVAAAFLKEAGAKSMTGVALGRFGNTGNYFDIDLSSDPFKPVKSGDFSYEIGCFDSEDKSVVHQQLKDLIS